MNLTFKTYQWKETPYSHYRFIVVGEKQVGGDWFGSKHFKARLLFDDNKINILGKEIDDDDFVMIFNKDDLELVKKDSVNETIKIDIPIDYLSLRSIKNIKDLNKNGAD